MKKDILFDFTVQDLARNNRNFLFVEGKEKIMQEIGMEILTLKGSLPHHPDYGSEVAGALGSKNVSNKFKESEVRRIADKHPVVEKVIDVWTEEERTKLTVKIYDSWGGGNASSAF